MDFVGEAFPEKITLEAPRTRKESAIRRRILYNLGIAAAKDFLALRSKHGGDFGK